MKKTKLSTKAETQKIALLLLEHYPDSVTELRYETLFELLVCVMLSAQCTDRRVNIITPALFEMYPDPESMSGADVDDIRSLIKSCSFFNNKANNLVKMSKILMSEYNGKVPLSRDELVKLPGVGQKTANVVMIEYTGANYMAVDTHVFRVSHRLGLSDAANVRQTEEDLIRLFETDLNRLHQAMVLFGRYTCKALKPECEKCFLTKYCKSRESFSAK